MLQLPRTLTASLAQVRRVACTALLSSISAIFTTHTSSTAVAALVHCILQPASQPMFRQGRWPSRHALPGSGRSPKGSHLLCNKGCPSLPLTQLTLAAKGSNLPCRDHAPKTRAPQALDLAAAGST